MRQATFPMYADRCGWTALLPARKARPSATGSIHARFAIVGAGFTGLAVSRRLAELDPTADIVLIEATNVGEGSSARNSGFVASADIAGSIDASAVQRNIARNKYVGEGFDWLTELISRYNIDCDLHLAGRIKGAATVAGETAVRDLQKIAEALDVPHRLLDTDQLVERIGTSYYRLGILTDVGHLVQPAALVRGLADSLPSNVRFYENTPAVNIRREGKWLIETPDARISADIVVVAANAAVKNFGYLRDRLVTIYTYIGLTQSMKPADSAKLGAMPSWGLLPAHRLGTTLRRAGTDRFVVRSLYSYETGVSRDYAHSQLLDRFHRRYPDLAHVELEHVWGGVTALTMNGSPFWGQIDDGLYTSAGCNGSGIVKGTILGKRLAELISGQSVEDQLIAAYGRANWIAPEPFRTIGYRVVSAIERRKAGLES